MPSSKNRHRVELPSDQYRVLKTQADLTGRTVAAVLSDAVALTLTSRAPAATGPARAPHIRRRVGRRCPRDRAPGDPQYYEQRVLEAYQLWLRKSAEDL